MKIKDQHFASDNHYTFILSTIYFMTNYEIEITQNNSKIQK